MTQVILTLHSYNVYLVIAAAAIAGIWGLILFFTKRPTNPSWRISLIVTAALGLLQGLLGVIMVIMGLKPGTGTGIYYLHYVYGGIAALALPIAITYATNGKNPRRDMLIFSIAALIVAAVAVRAWMTGPVSH
ncbi:MAG TPA: hypothetical protein VFU49_19980 [Ktedonobacteraceae bacterium]|nr:hypothetical protein [Ktedonobacteraceae bacterium]